MAKRTFLFFLTSLLVFSCKKEDELTFSEIQVTTNNNTIVEVFIPKATGNKATSKAINTEIENFIASLLEIGEPKAKTKPSSLTKQIEAFNSEYTNFIKDFPEVTQLWEAQIDGEVIYQSKDIVSIAITAYLNTGGAHGNTNISFLNFDAATGKRILKEKLITNTKAFTNIAKTYFNEELTDKSILFEPESFTLPENIGISEEGIILLYNTYEIAPYASGIIEFTIPFEKIKNYLIFNSF
ncbi:uncharacterized protein DUF3298 [Jejuia pallidilutea]|uniref:Uncharacterized protein DUF3298 n=1 Tax=Jejuia pallidilutea TaxID=504487 RepID=A0A362X497_9FLAO|nr:DUF3298 and DUF4163 domain-containing protein [Jejuia pallidilutea]PQV49399.1 uncharacterized protein DUF3298 [Jejuia pallidilutea]